MTKSNLSLKNIICKEYAIHERYTLINKTEKMKTLAKNHKYSKSELFANAVNRKNANNNNFLIFLVSTSSMWSFTTIAQLIH